MRIINFEMIKSLKISPETCFQWVKEMFLKKNEALLPAKTSISLGNNIFFNTMPCCLSSRYMGVKVVSRFPERSPALNADLILYDSSNGELLALMDATWITAMRTGAVAALAALTYKKQNAVDFSFIGLGNTARATLLCLHSQLPAEQRIRIHLLKYKDQAECFMSRFADLPNIEFSIETDIESVIAQRDVLFSCVTACDGLFAKDDVYPEGILVVPVHTRGFQNCDLFFDKVFADDRAHVCGFKYFDRFKYFAELSDVLTGKKAGRENSRERILSYNIGIALHDIYFASKIYELCPASEIKQAQITDKSWV